MSKIIANFTLVIIMFTLVCIATSVEFNGVYRPNATTNHREDYAGKFIKLTQLLIELNN